MGREDEPIDAKHDEPHEPARVGVASACPDCVAGSRSRCGSRVPGLTLRSLLTETATSRLSDAEGFRFCGSPVCETVYWKPETGERFAKNDLRVRVGLKETTPPRPVCYCFGYSVEDIERQVRETGSSSIPDEITAKVRDGLCHCEDANPQGTCCLGNVRAAVKAVSTSSAAAPEARPSPGDGGHACCAREAVRPTPPSEAASRAGILASAGAVVSAILASACCWLPLLLAAFGASSASLANFFEHYRALFLGSSAALLGLGFSFVSFRKPTCGPDGACPAPSVRLQQFNKIVLSVAAALVVVAGAFPRYVGVFLHGGNDRASVDVGERRVYSIEGMTCEACAVTIRSELERVPGVASADVSFERKEATITTQQGAPTPADSAVLAATARAGHRATRKGKP